MPQKIAWLVTQSLREVGPVQIEQGGFLGRQHNPALHNQHRHRGRLLIHITIRLEILRDREITDFAIQI
jgi:hypothetical protein